MSSHPQSPIQIDGTFGEGGGQILRTSLALSIITNTPFTITNIRANRRKPGLLRQHLTAVKAAAEISSAHTEGVHLGSSALSFTPHHITPGNYHFSIGSAGSTTLVLQTILPALLTAPSPSTITIDGGTHNPHAPTANFLTHAFIPLINAMGPTIDFTLIKPGFYPAGGGQIRAHITPSQTLTPIDLPSRSDINETSAHAIVTGLPPSIANRELLALHKKLNWPLTNLHQHILEHDLGPGNTLETRIALDSHTEVITVFGEKDLSAESVARRAAKHTHDYLSSQAPIGRYLADQLLIPLALAKQGQFLTTYLTKHTTTNIHTIQQFLPIKFTITQSIPGRNLIALHP